MFSKKAFVCMIIAQLGTMTIYSQVWKDWNDYIGKWKFGKTSVLEITKDLSQDEQPQCNIVAGPYTDWKFKSVEFKQSEWHILFERDPKLSEINKAIPEPIREEISNPNSSNKNTWYLEIIPKHDQETTLHKANPCNNTLKVTWYRGIINWDKKTNKLRSVFNYPMTEAKFSPYINEDKEKVTDHIEEYTGTRVTYEIPDWNSMVFDWKTDPLTKCADLSKKRINEYFLSKAATHAFVELFKAMKPPTSNPIAETAWDQVKKKLEDLLKDFVKDQVKKYTLNKLKQWANNGLDDCRFDIIENHALYDPTGYVENKLVGSNIFMIWLIDKYLATAKCIIIVDNSKVKDANDCKETMTIACELEGKLPEKSGEGGGMQKWKLLGELADYSLSVEPQPGKNTGGPCDPPYERLIRVKTAFNTAKGNSAVQKLAMDNALIVKNAAQKQHDDYEAAKGAIANKQDEIKELNRQIRLESDPRTKRNLQAQLSIPQDELKKLNASLTQLASGESDYQDKAAKYNQARKTWQDAFCRSIQNDIKAGNWSQDDINYFNNCYNDEDLKKDYPKCN